MSEKKKGLFGKGLKGLFKRDKGSKNKQSKDDDKGGDDSAPNREQSSRKIQNLEAKINQHKRAKVMGKIIQVTDDAKLPDKVPKSNKEIEFLQNALSDNFIFSALDAKELRLLIDVMQKEVVQKGHMIIKQGDVGDFFYVVEEGTVNFLIGDGQHVGSCGSGASFGELALLYDAPRAATCVADSPGVLWKVDQGTFRFLLAKNADSEEKKTTDLLRGIPLFSNLNQSTLNKFANALTRVPFKVGDRIVNKGDVGEVFYLIEEGKVKIHDIGHGTEHVDTMIGPGGYFGERALLTGEPRAASCTAVSDVVTFAMDRKTFELSIGSLESSLKQQMKKSCLEALPVIAKSRITPAEMNKLVKKMSEHKFKKGDKLAEAGKPFPQQIIIFRQGKVSVASTAGEIHVLHGGDQYGDQTIQLEEGVNECPDTVVVDEDTEAYILTKKDMEKVIGDIKRLGKQGGFVSKRQNKSIVLKDLKKHRVLGMGAFGLVWLVSHSDKKDPYALKMLSKRELIDSHMVSGTVREKDILASLDHPFILPLISSFQDDESLYLLLELIQGGELFNVIHDEKSRRRGLPNTDAMFYGACILDALGHFHERLICYRDLKPENVLVDAQGYCIMVDLGFAKIVANKTFTLCGTPEYLAPEIITSKGHNKAVDWWAFGVLVYEMLMGKSPFYRPYADQITLFKNIVRVQYNIPDHIDDNAKDLIYRLLQKRETNRLGNLARGHLDVAEHAFFKPINFDRLLEKELKAPWIPEVKDAFDASHFEDFRGAEKKKRGLKKLNKEEQKQFDGF